MSDNDLSPGYPIERALDESAEELYEMAPCGYLTTTLDGRIIKVNRTLLEWLGYERSELLNGKRFVDLLTVGGRIFFETHFSLLLRVQRSVDEIALDLISKTGRVIPALINARQKRNAEERPVLNRFTVFNASERRRYERDLLEARDLLRITLASIGDGVIATDTAGRITFINPVGEQLSGWSEDFAIGKPVEEVLLLVREDQGAPIENPVIQALRSNSIVALRTPAILVARDGHGIPVDDSASPIRGADGGVVGAVVVFRDVSARKEAEKNLKHAHEQLAMRAHELRRSNEDLSHFAHVASHDLRSPLNTINQYAQLLDRRYGDQLGDGTELLSYLRSAARRMNDLIEDLLSYAQVSGERTRPGAMADANIQFDSAVANLQSSIDESGAIVTRDDLPAVGIEPISLLQIFQNLIGNAIHYRGRETPHVHVSAREDSGSWLFSCSDNGIGIPAAFHKQIFEPFKRLHGEDRPGSGIGLAVCKRIVERTKGNIWVESQVNQGSTFFFTLPKVGSESAEAVEASVGE